MKKPIKVGVENITPYRNGNNLLSKEDAFDLLQKDRKMQLAIYDSFETERSWVFVVMSSKGEMLVGAPPFVVDKRSGRVFMSKDALLEFEKSQSLANNFIRWWCRKYVY